MSTAFRTAMVLCAMILLFITDAAAQNKEKAERYYNQGMTFFQRRQWKEAEKKLKDAIEADREFLDAYLLLADIQRQSNPEGAVQTWLELEKNIPGSYAGWFNIGGYAMSINDYDRAIDAYKRVLGYKLLKPEHRGVAERNIAKAGKLAPLMKNPVKIDKQEMFINTGQDEYLPSITIDGRQLLFTRREKFSRNEDPYKRVQEDLVMAHKKGKDFRDPAPLRGSINTPDANEGGSCFSPDGNYLLFTGCERRDGLGGCDLYISFNKRGEWSAPINLDAINTRFNEKQPSISGNGRWLYFASNRPGTLGGLDIYRCEIIYKDNVISFTEPQNLGPTVNTPQDDQTPFIASDGATLYFASYGWPGFGNNDLFISRYNGRGWDSAQNMGYGINTADDDMGLIVDPAGEFAYMGTNKDGIGGSIDIIKFPLPRTLRPEPVTYLKARLVDAHTGAPVQGFISVYRVADTIIYTPDNSPLDTLHIVLVPGEAKVGINAGARGYLPYSESLDVSKIAPGSSYERVIKLFPAKAGARVDLRNIYFDTDKWNLKSESRAELGVLAYLLRKDKNIKIEISGHTDATGNAANNQTLSLNRAKAVYDYLISAGVDKAQLSFKGYGSSRPIAPNNTEEGKAKNRRTEIEVVK